MANIYPVVDDLGNSSVIYPSGSANQDPDYSGIFIPTVWAGKLLN